MTGCYFFVKKNIFHILTTLVAALLSSVMVFASPNNQKINLCSNIYVVVSLDDRLIIQMNAFSQRYGLDPSQFRGKQNLSHDITGKMNTSTLGNVRISIAPESSFSRRLGRIGKLKILKNNSFSKKSDIHFSFKEDNQSQNTEEYDHSEYPDKLTVELQFSNYPPKINSTELFSDVQPKTEFPYPEVLGKKISFSISGEDKKYHMINVGSRQLKRDWQHIQGTIDFLLRQNENANHIFHMNPSWVRGREVLFNLQRWSSQLVMDVYRERKKYLSQDELSQFREDDENNRQNDDYLVLLNNSGLSPLSMSFDEFKENVLAVVRLARFENFDPSFPPSIVKKYAEISNLPFGYLINKLTSGKIIRETFLGLNYLAGKKIAEVSRFVRFKEIPTQTMNYFVQSLFELSVNSTDPVDILIICVDHFTRELFKSRYGFHDLAEISNQEDYSAESEYLMYMDTNSPEFTQNLNRLKSASNIINEVPVVNFPKLRTWSLPFADSNSQKEGSVDHKIFESFRVRRNISKLLHNSLYARHLDTTTLNSVISNLSFVPIENQKRLLQIASWVNEKDISNKLLEIFNSLDEKQKHILFQNTQFYADMFIQKSIAIGTSFPLQGKHLLIGDVDPLLIKVLRDQFVGRQIINVDSKMLSSNDFISAVDVVYDSVSVFNVFEMLKSRKQQFLLLQNLFKKLKRGGHLIIFLPSGSVKFTTEQDSKYDLKTVVIDYANELMRNNASMNELELALELVRFRHQVGFLSTSFLDFYSITDVAASVGFNTDSGGTIGTFPNSIEKIILIKP